MPLDVKIAWRNIWRNPRRSALTLLAVAFACALLVFMLSFQFGSYEAMINASVKIQTGHLQIQAAGYHDKMDMFRVVPDPETVRARLGAVTGVAEVTSRANAFCLVSSEDRTYGAMVTGVEPAGEASMSTLKTLVRLGRYLNAADGNQALLGKLLAQNLRVEPGDELTIVGQARDGSVAATVVTVAGVFSSGMDAFDRGVVQIPLTAFQSVFAMGDAVHQVVANCSSLAEVSRVKKEAAAFVKTPRGAVQLEVLDWIDLVPGLFQSIKMDLVSGLIMYVILILVVAFSILNTFLMAIFERAREFGVMMAVGTTPGRLTRLLLFESMTLTFLGVTVGIVAGGFVTAYFQAHGVDFSGASEMLAQFGISGRIHPRLSWASVAIGPAIVSVITFCVALYPAFRIRRLNPVEAINYV